MPLDAIETIDKLPGRRAALGKDRPKKESEEKSERERTNKKDSKSWSYNDRVNNAIESMPQLVTGYDAARSPSTWNVELEVGDVGVVPCPLHTGDTTDRESRKYIERGGGKV